MARPLRIEYEDAVYHVTARGNKRRKIYFTKTDYQKFLQYIAEAKKKFGILIHSYVLMGNHYHLIIETPEANLSKALHHINSSYTTYINHKRKRSGHLFQGRYKAIVVSKDNYLVELSRYIHLNPFRAGKVEKPEEYQYSSYKTYKTGKKDEILTQDLILGLIAGHKSEARRKYKAFVETAMRGNEEPDEVVKDVFGGIILGGTKFIKETLERIKEEYLIKEEVSQRRALQSKHGVEEVLDLVSNKQKVSREDITGNRFPEKRKIAIYLIKKHTQVTNRQIGEMFGGISYSAVAKVYNRFEQELMKNRRIRREIKKIEKAMSNVKG